MLRRVLQSVLLLKVWSSKVWRLLGPLGLLVAVEWQLWLLTASSLHWLLQLLWEWAGHARLFPAVRGMAAAAAAAASSWLLGNCTSQAPPLSPWPLERLRKLRIHWAWVGV